jgi:hypothetical protein
MPLIKHICKRCHETYWGPWDQIAEAHWNSGQVRCKHFPTGKGLLAKFFSGRVSCRNEPPKDCPYILEYTLEDQQDNLPETL